jgi:hypothetical protein
LNGYFPDAVIEAARNRIGVPRFSKDDVNFLISNAGLGLEWLARRFYVSVRTIRERAMVSKAKVPELYKKPHTYTQKEEQFILDNLEQGIEWIASQLKLDVDRIRRKAERLKKKKEKELVDNGIMKADVIDPVKVEIDNKKTNNNDKPDEQTSRSRETIQPPQEENSSIGRGI